MSRPLLQGSQLPDSRLQCLHGEDERRTRWLAPRILGADGSAQDGRPRSGRPRITSPLRPNEPRLLGGPWTRRSLHLQLDEWAGLLRQAVHICRGAVGPLEDAHQPLSLRLRTARRGCSRGFKFSCSVCKLARSLRSLSDGSRSRGWTRPAKLPRSSGGGGTLLSLPKTRRTPPSLPCRGGCLSSLSCRPPPFLCLPRWIPSLTLCPLRGSTLKPSESEASGGERLVLVTEVSS